MSNNRILGNLASYIDSASNGGAITKVGNDFFIQAMTDSDVGGTPATGIPGTDSASVKDLITTSRVVQKSGRAKNAPGLKNVLQGDISKLNPSITATYNIGDSSNPIDEIILDSSATIFFGDISLTSILKSGTSTIAVATILLPPSNSSYTTLLLKTDSTQTDAQVDTSTNAATITENGNVTSTAFTPHHPGGYSTYFDHNGDYFTYTAGNEIGFGTGDFTVEFWAYPDYSGNLNNKVIDTRNASNWLIQLDARSTPIFTWYDGSSSIFSYDISTTENKWTHFAVTREGTSLRLFVNGTLADTVTDNNNYTVGSGDVYIGRRYNDTLDYYDGYLRDLRVIKGTAVYTSNFTPPTEPLTAISGTQLLTCHLPYIADGSTNGHAITIYGNTSTKRFGPYDYFSYSPSSYGGSVYFDGSGDYLSMPSSEGYKFGTGDFTIEGWMYFDTLSTSVGQTVIDCWQGTNNYNWLVSFDADTFTFAAGNNGAYSAGNTHNVTTSLSAGNWYHFAVTRESSSLRCFINGVQQGSTLSNTANISDNIPVYIGTNQDGGGYPFSGHISDIRIVKGTAVYTADFTPPTEPLTAIAGTELLTCTNKNSIYDISGGSLLTVNGDTTTSVSQTKYASASIYMDGSADSIELSKDLDLPIYNFSTADWTIEFWVHWLTLSSSKTVFSFIRQNTAGGYETPHIYTHSSGTIRYWTAGVDRISGGTTLGTGTWYHIAVCRSGNDHKMFLNGVQEGSTWSNAYTYVQGRPTLGDFYQNFGTVSGGSTFHGYIEDVRITKGVARYTANFTPPTAALEG